MLYLLLGLLALAIGMTVVRWFTSVNPRLLAHWLMRAAGFAAFAGAAVLLARGVFGYALPLAVFGWWLINGQGLFVRGGVGRMGGPRGARVSKVRTDHVEMELDHESGAMSGRVLKGFFAGRELDDMKPVELAHLWQDCRFVDPGAAQLVEAYLDRLHPSWREDMARAETGAEKGPDGRMGREEALDILGLEPDADEAAVRAAHRELMLKLHPDRGGSTYLAAKINEAKDVLLGKG